MTEENAAPPEETDQETVEEVDLGPLAYGVPVTESFGQTVLHPAPDQLIETATALKQDGFCMVIDLTVVDYLTHPGRTDLPSAVTPQRFEVVVALINHQQSTRIRLRVQAGNNQPTVPSLFDLFPGTEAMEREAWDLFGVTFTDHPDHSRILMPDDWEGHPLRKDHAVGDIPVQFSTTVGNR